MTKAPFTVGDTSAAAAVPPPPPPVDPGSDSDSDQGHQYSLRELVIHAVDDHVDGRRRPAPLARLPVQQRRPAPPALDAIAAPEQGGYIERMEREAARLDRLGFFQILPQAVLCFWNVALGITMVCFANSPEMQASLVAWVTTCSALVVLSTLVSMLISYLAVNHYDGWPCLDRWLASPPREDNYNVPMYY